MKFYSTNGHSEASLAQALLTGQAPDKGLYMPRQIPQLAPEEWKQMKGWSYPAIALQILKKYTSELVDEQTLKNMVEETYDFPIPLEKASDARFIMRLDQGKTASFKDFAAGMMGHWLSYLLENTREKLIILTATSGDTGSAIAHAFHRKKGIDVVILFPQHEVTKRQRQQMTTLGDNITTIAIDGKFDDCQLFVKRAFADPQLHHLPLTSANSINIGRLLPQIVYYAYAYSQLADFNEPIVFSVPSGNFGNAMGALLAWRMGLPIQRLIVATNSNDEVPRFLKSGQYKKIVPSRKCISNAMNVGHPSNFARIIDLFGGQMDEQGNLLKSPNLQAMRQLLWSISIDDQETLKTIENAWKNDNILLEPHGAVAWRALELYRQNTDDHTLAVSIETAHPAKFPETIERLLNIDIPLPPSLKNLHHNEENFLKFSPQYEDFRAFLKEKFSTL